MTAPPCWYWKHIPLLVFLVIIVEAVAINLSRRSQTEGLTSGSNRTLLRNSLQGVVGHKMSAFGASGGRGGGGGAGGIDELNGGPKLDKVSQEGSYLPFPGFTSVASVINVDGENNKLFHRLYDILKSNSLITSYFALLPIDSYHITILGVVCKTRMSEKGWSQWFTSHIDSLVDTHKQFEEKTRGFNFRISSLDGGDAPRLTLYVTMDLDTEITFRTLAKSTASLQHTGMPQQGFHITLGYQYRPYDNTTIFPRIKQAVVAALVDVFGVGYQLTNFVAKKPKVCYYPDMTVFIPLDSYAAFRSKLANAESEIDIIAFDLAKAGGNI